MFIRSIVILEISQLQINRTFVNSDINYSYYSFSSYNIIIRNIAVSSISLLRNRVQNMCLCLGPTGSGKTLLLRKLQRINAVDETTTAVPTVGTNIFHLRRASIHLEVRELGGVMAPIWPKYFGGTNKIMYVVDASNLCQIAASGVLLYTVLADPQIKNAKVLLVLTKMDVSYRQMRNEALLMLQMRRLQKEVKQEITVIEASAITGEGRGNILQWLFAEDTKRSILS